MKVTYRDLASFHEGCYFFLKVGASFEAHAETLTIQLTGGY